MGESYRIISDGEMRLRDRLRCPALVVDEGGSELRSPVAQEFILDLFRKMVVSDNALWFRKVLPTWKKVYAHVLNQF